MSVSQRYQVIPDLLYAKLEKTLREKLQNGELETFLRNVPENRKFLVDNGVNEMSLLSVIISQPVSKGSLLPFITSACSQELLKELITLEDLQRFVTQECLAHTFGRDCSSVVEDFRGRAENSVQNNRQQLSRRSTRRSARDIHFAVRSSQ